MMKGFLKLQKHDTVQKGALDLLVAVSCEDKAAISSALREMGFSFVGTRARVP